MDQASCSELVGMGTAAVVKTPSVCDGLFSLVAHGGAASRLCVPCGQTFDTPGNCYRHVRDVHQKTRRFKCVVCGQEFTQKSNLERHHLLHKVDGRKSFHCTYCGKDYSSHQYLGVHMARLHGGSQGSSCALCGFLAANPLALVVHTGKMHSTYPRFACTVCEFLGETFDIVRSHVSSIHPKPTFCHPCSEDHSHHGNLRKHHRVLCTCFA
jgi:KRAB domain-containing zinc finger protein